MSFFKKKRVSYSGKAVSYALGTTEDSEKFDEWKLYFTDEEYNETSETYGKVEAFGNYINRNSPLFSIETIIENEYFCVDLKKIKEDKCFQSQWESFAEDLNKNAEYTLNCLSFAMLRTIKQGAKVAQSLTSCEEPVQQCASIIKARISNHEPIILLKNLKVNYYGKLVSVRGTVIRVTNIRLQCEWLVYRCKSCGFLQVVKQVDETCRMPSKCPSRGCKSQSNFVPMLSSAHTRTVACQTVKLQETVAGEHRDAGRIPRTVECELKEDLVGKCVPGDDITITGVIKVRNTQQQKSTSTFLLYIDGMAITNTRHAKPDLEYTMTDYYAIRKIHSEPQLFRLLVHSLCPSIYGHEIIKAGLLLSLFSGTRTADTRSDCHILVVGDPGLGKSQLLQACRSAAPRGIFICGVGTTGAGLTAIVTRESGQHNLEAGALVLASGGVCCIDEFDKMQAQHGALLEAMEQQTVSMAKAGVVCTLPAQTSIIAAANPIGGHYNRGRTVSENLRLSAALLSRFDLVFVLLDQPDASADVLLSEHVLALHSGGNPGSSTRSVTSMLAAPDLPDQQALGPRLQMNEVNTDVIPHVLLRKFIGYARTYVHPKLSKAAAQALKDFYMELRKKHQSNDSAPVTTRQLESLVRLAQARARLELREVVSLQDANDVIDVMKHSLVDTLIDDYGRLDFQRSQLGSGVSCRATVKRALGLLQRLAERNGSAIFTMQQLKDCLKVAGTGIYDLVGSLNVDGLLLKKGPNLYQLTTVDC